jgi:hypothetical protein
LLLSTSTSDSQANHWLPPFAIDIQEREQMDSMVLLLKIAAALAILAMYVKWRRRLITSEQAVSGINQLATWMGNNKTKVLRYARVAEVLVGLFLVLFGCYIGKDHFHLIREGARTPGTIVGYKQESFPDRGNTHWDTAFMPIVKFQARGRDVEFKDWMGSHAAVSWKIPVTVLYDPADPSVAMIDRPVWNWIPWAPTFAVGLFLVLVGIKGLSASADVA